MAWTVDRSVGRLSTSVSLFFSSTDDVSRRTFSASREENRRRYPSVVGMRLVGYNHRHIVPGLLTAAAEV